MYSDPIHDDKPLQEPIRCAHFQNRSTFHNNVWKLQKRFADYHASKRFMSRHLILNNLSRLFYFQPVANLCLFQDFFFRCYANFLLLVAVFSGLLLPGTWYHNYHTNSIYKTNMYLLLVDRRFLSLAWFDCCVFGVQMIRLYNFNVVLDGDKAQ